METPAIGSRQDFLAQAAYARGELKFSKRMALGSAALGGSLFSLSAVAFTLGGENIINGVIGVGVGTALGLGSAGLMNDALEAAESVSYYQELASQAKE